MIFVFLVAAALILLILVVVSFVQQLYLDSLRLRTRELPALTYFKEVLEERFGAKTEDGAMAYSVIKHMLLVLLGITIHALTVLHQTAVWSPFFGACLFGLLGMLLCSYLIPQILYRRTIGHWVLPLVPLLKVIALAARPITGLLGFSLSLVELGKEAPREVEQPTSQENIDALITAGTEEGILEEDDRKLIQSVVEFGDKTVREVMTPRPNVVAIEEDKSLEHLRQLVIHERFSRIPVYHSTIDQMVGFVHVRDMFELDAKDLPNRKVKELVRKVNFVPETKPITDLLREMQSDGAHMAVVVDEYGNTAGLVTMEDLLEEIFGEIHDEHEPSRDLQVEPNGSYVVSGSFDLDHLSDLLEFRPPEQTESTTVGGLVTEWLGHIPQVGETVDREGIHMEVLAGNELRVERVRIAKSNGEHVQNS